MEEFVLKIKYRDYRRIPAFLEAVAEYCLQELSHEDKQIILNNQKASLYHFDLGLYIRNEFLYPQRCEVVQEIEKTQKRGEDISALQIDRIFVEDLMLNADEYSREIIEHIIENLQKLNHE